VTEPAFSTAEAVARRGYGKLVALLAARTRDVAAAEDALSGAFALALERWPRDGCPANPEGWLVTVARRKAIDLARKRERDDSAAAHLRILTEGLGAAAGDAPIPDQRLALLFTCAHPAIDAAIRAPLMLQAVLDAVYAAFAEGWSDGSGTDVARRRARRDSAGEYVPFAEQDPGLWDWRMIEEAEALIRAAGAMGRIGRYQLEAALQSAHVYRRRAGADNWSDVVRLYDALLALTASPVVAVNRAMAVAELHGAEAALAAIEPIAADPRLIAYQPYWAARAELLARAGAHAEARRAYDLAIGLERDPAVRRFLARRRR
jgi:RNA polymerase sigma-70 factor (ECF subfamily)